MGIRTLFSDTSQVRSWPSSSLHRSGNCWALMGLRPRHSAWSGAGALDFQNVRQSGHADDFGRRVKGIRAETRT
jgi:hypothetical protein